MRRAFLVFLTAATVLATGVALASDEAAGPEKRYENIHVIDLAGVVDPMLRAYLDRRLDSALEAGADCIVLRIDSPGGMMNEMRTMGDRLFGLDKKVHTVAWVPQMALSAAAFISLACDEIVLGAEASLGDSQPITQSPDGKPQRIGEKIESPARAWFRNYAQGNGYPVLLAAAMVSVEQEVLRVRDESTGTTHFVDGKTFRDAKPDDVILPKQNLRRADLIQVGGPLVTDQQLLTMTPEEAAEYGFVTRRFGESSIPANESVLLDALKAPEATITQWKMNFSEHAGRFLLAIAGVLSALVVIAIMVTLWQGPGTMTIVGIAALIISMIIYGTVEHLHGFPLFLLLLGAALLAAEVFVIPGFGIAGILGLISMATGFLFLAAGTTIGDSAGKLTQEGIVNFGLQFVVTTLIGFTLMFTMSRFFPKIGPARRMVLASPTGATVGGVHEEWLPSLGNTGVALSDLRPVGTARIGDEEVSVVSVEGFLPVGSTLRVVQIEGNEVRVQADEGTAS